MVQGIYLGSTSAMQRAPTVHEFQNQDSIDPSLLSEDPNRPAGSGGFAFGHHSRPYRICVSANLIRELIRRYQAGTNVGNEKN